MVRRELGSPHAATINNTIASTPMQRGGPTEEVAHTVAFLSTEVSYNTGSDIVVDNLMAGP